MDVNTLSPTCIDSVLEDFLPGGNCGPYIQECPLEHNKDYIVGVNTPTTSIILSLRACSET